MMAGMYAAISGLDANQAMLNETANDLANVNTVGYKAASVTFADSLTQVIRGASGPDQHQRWHQPDADRARRAGRRRPVNEMTEGAFQTTNNPLDVAIEGPGLPARRRRARPRREPSRRGFPANVQYTRAGDLTTNAAGLPDDAGAANT